ncbi:MAG TPA: efflux RND transporter periplasmic adaptor subunit [Terriglobales bacterium]|nr:efflux RND transporter periplasmic adaptor subunit [Terriglobales bacterium]
MRKRFVVITVGILALVALVVVVEYRARDRDSDPRAAEIPTAAVAIVTRGPLSNTLSLAGQFQPYQEIDVHAKVSGYVQRIYVDIGDRVRAGQTLAVLEIPELDAQLKGTQAEVLHSKDEVVRAENDVIRAESDHAALHAAYERLRQAAEARPGLIAEQELDDSQSKDLATAAQVDAAKAALSAARQQTAVSDADRMRVGALAAYANVTAPLTGVITWRYADTGALIQAGTASNTQSMPLVKLAQSDVLRLRLPVPESAVAYIHTGAPVQVQVKAIGRTFDGKVVRFTRSVSLDTRTMETEIDVNNADLSLTPGMYADTTIELEHKENALSVPVQAVVQDANEHYVLVVDDQDRVRKRQVDLGEQTSNAAEILHGLSEKERVIVGGQSNYQVGEVVKPRLEPDSAAADGSQTGEQK